MDYEKKYKEAAKAVESLLFDAQIRHSKSVSVNALADIFPEFKESDDERIREELTEFLKNASGGFLDTTIQCETFRKWLSWLKEHCEQKPWSEKDEKYLNDAIDACKAQYGNMSYTADWLKNLEDRIQLQTIWEPSDESMLNAIANSLDRGRVERVWHTTIEEVVDRLKSFKYRCTWKPSDEQMETLKLSTYCPSERMSKVLFELYEDLKKLRDA